MSEKQQHDIATREEALALLTDHARKGSATAAAALARELRAREAETEDQALAEELDAPDPAARLMAEARGRPAAQHPLELRRATSAWVELKAFHLAVLIPLPIGRSTFQQLQPRHAGDDAIGVQDRVDEPLRRERYAVLKARNGRRARPRALSDLPLRRAGVLARGT